MIWPIINQRGEESEQTGPVSSSFRGHPIEGLATDGENVPLTERFEFLGPLGPNVQNLQQLQNYSTLIYMRQLFDSLGMQPLDLHLPSSRCPVLWPSVSGTIHSSRPQFPYPVTQEMQNPPPSMSLNQGASILSLKLNPTQALELHCERQMEYPCDCGNSSSMRSVIGHKTPVDVNKPRLTVYSPPVMETFGNSSLTSSNVSSNVASETSYQSVQCGTSTSPEFSDPSLIALSGGQDQKANSPQKYRSDSQHGVLQTEQAGEPLDSSKRYRTSYTQHQIHVLEKTYNTERYISRPQRTKLSHELKLPENTIKVWFQNRRMKEKRQALMLPTIAGKDPYLRETLLRVAQLYYATRYANDSTPQETNSRASHKIVNSRKDGLIDSNPVSSWNTGGEIKDGNLRSAFVGCRSTVRLQSSAFCGDSNDDSQNIWSPAAMTRSPRLDRAPSEEFGVNPKFDLFGEPEATLQLKFPPTRMDFSYASKTNDINTSSSFTINEAPKTCPNLISSALQLCPAQNFQDTVVAPKSVDARGTKMHSTMQNPQTRLGKFSSSGST
ncbi:unnamed protein product [Calicophoron daubneyi]|uniref:Homeobox domain-containing protein n=1 Tax=Calicophoron daubneyi TaxID=300641 RepID=A0AAV2TGT5_CALDB